jgi:hypothetical protein
MDLVSPESDPRRALGFNEIGQGGDGGLGKTRRIYFWQGNSSQRIENAPLDGMEANQEIKKYRKL